MWLKKALKRSFVQHDARHVSFNIYYYGIKKRLQKIPFVHRSFSFHPISVQRQTKISLLIWCDSITLISNDCCGAWGEGNVDRNRNDKKKWLMWMSHRSVLLSFSCSNLLEKTSDVVIKAAKNGDLVLVSLSPSRRSFSLVNLFFCLCFIDERTSLARVFTAFNWLQRSDGTSPC